MEPIAIQNQTYHTLPETQNKQKTPAADAAAASEKAAPVSKTQDQFTHGIQTPSTGIYQPTQDSDGKMRIIYDSPAAVSADQTAPDTQSKISPNDPQNQPEDEKTENCTINTDAVDQEIKQLKQKKQELEQQITTAHEEPEKSADLENKLADIEHQLTQKDTNTYRKQHAVVS